MSLLDRCHEYVTLPLSGRRVCLWCEQPEPLDRVTEPEPMPAAQVMCRQTTGHLGHVWYGDDGRARWCGGVNIVRWWNAVVEQQGRDRQAEQ